MNPDQYAKIIVASISAAMELVNLLSKAASSLQQSEELSPAASKALDDKIENLNKQEWWKIEE